MLLFESSLRQNLQLVRPSSFYLVQVTHLTVEHWIRFHCLPSRKCSGTLRKNLLLAPTSIAPTSMLDMVVDSKSHRDRMFEAQQLRGRIALREGAVDPTQLVTDGRHVQAADYRSWHLLTLDAHGRVAACMRYLTHRRDASFSDLAISRSTLAKSKTWGAQLCGGALGISTASTQHCSSAILKRIGGQQLQARGVELPSFYDEHYRCHMQVLRFDSSQPNPRYRKWMDACRASLSEVPVICRDATVSEVSA